MSITEISVTQIADWLLFRKSTNCSIVLFLGSRTGGLFKNKKFYEQIQNHNTIQFDALNEQEKFYECYRTLSRLEPTEKSNILTTSLRERPMNLLEYRYLAILVKEGLVDIIITTNIDTFLEDALQREKVKESRNYQILVCGKHSTNDIIHLPNNACALLKVFGNLKNNDYYRTAGNEFDLRADKKLRGYLERLLARDILVIGYDKEWDCPLEWAFPYKGEDFMYVNEVPPTPELLLTRALRSRKGSYLALSQQEKPIDFMRELYFELKGKTSEDNKKLGWKEIGSRKKTTRTRIFISYSHKDALYLQRLKVFLQDYSLRGLIDDWDDTQILVGANWFEEIKNTLRMTKVAVLLLSADFFASKFINEYELPILLEGAEAGEIKLIPVILSPCDFYNTRLSSYQSVNSPFKPLRGMRRDQKDKVWEEVKRHVLEIYQDM